MATLRAVQQPGLLWESSLFGDAPAWSKEPFIDVIEKIARRYLKCRCVVAFLAQGAFNKVYTVECRKGTFIFRATLPVSPKAKTLSEVATMTLVRTKTTVPVPKVIAYNADLNNELGFEWILMERVNGRTLRQRWHELSWLKKGLLVEQIVGFMSELSQLKLSCIGSVYQYHLDSRIQDTKTPPSLEHVVGEAIRGQFFTGDHIRLDIYRGPYRTSAEYVTAHTQFLLHDIVKWRVSDDEDDQDLAEEVQAIYDKLQLVIPKLFPGTNTELTSIYHDDLSSNNIIVDDDGNLAGIIDWECIISAPKWEACQIPSFIAGADDDRVAEPLTEEEMKDEQAVEDHKDLVYNYEATQLKKFFLEEMARVNPQWIQTYNDESTRRDIMLAIEFADNDMYQSRIKGWLKCLLEDRTPKMTLTQSIIDPSGLR